MKRTPPPVRRHRDSEPVSIPDCSWCDPIHNTDQDTEQGAGQSTTPVNQEANPNYWDQLATEFGIVTRSKQSIYDHILKHKSIAERNSKLTMSDHIRPKIFTGSTPVRQWVHRYEQVAKVHRWDDPTKLAYLPLYLEGQPQLWHMSVEAEHAASNNRDVPLTGNSFKVPLVIIYSISSIFSPPLSYPQLLFQQ